MSHQARITGRTFPATISEDWGALSGDICTLCTPDLGTLGSRGHEGVAGQHAGAERYLNCR